MQEAVIQSTRARGIPPTALRGSGEVGSTERWLTGVGGALFFLKGMRRGGFGGLLSTVLGGLAVARAASGYCPVYGSVSQNPVEKKIAETFDWSQAAAVSRSVTIQKSPREVYEAWKDPDNIPRFMQSIESAKPIGEKRTEWTAKGALGQTVRWTTELTEDEPGKRISWKSAEGSDYNTSGTVTFRPAPGGRGTEVTFMLAYEPPAGQAGRVIAQLFRLTPTQQARQDLHSFKQVMETGEIATGAPNREQFQHATA